MITPALCGRSSPIYAALQHSHKLPFILRRGKDPAKIVTIRDTATVLRYRIVGLLQLFSDPPRSVLRGNQQPLIVQAQDRLRDAPGTYYGVV